MGYYQVLDDNEGIACTLLPPDAQGGAAIYKVDGATDYYVNNPYEPDSDYSFMLAGGRARMAGLSGYFVEKGITFPELTEWKFHGLEFRTPEPQGKRRRADDDNGFEPSAASGDNTPCKGARTSTVAAALRHRLAKAEPAGGTPVKTEPCAEEAMEAAPPLSQRRVPGQRWRLFFEMLSLARRMWFSAMGVHLAASSLARGMWFSAMSVPQWTSRSCTSYEHGVWLRAVSSFRH